jgi:pimeloyl-ACP methyl ester carboxylesterase
MAKKLSDILGHDIADTPAIVSEQTRAMRRSDVTSRLAELAGIPALVINGDQDMIAPPALGKRLAAGIPGARYVEIAGGAHSFPVVDPDECAELVLAYLAEHSRIAI